MSVRNDRSDSRKTGDVISRKDKKSKREGWRSSESRWRDEEVEVRGNKWEIEEDLVLKERKIYMLKNEKLSVTITFSCL